jgi:hypothetical protein
LIEYIGLFVDEFKSAHPNLTVWDSAGLDVVVSAIKNAAMAKSSGPGFALAFQIGFTMDMAALTTQQTLAALEKAVELNAAEDMMHQSSIKLAIQSIAAKNTANDIFKQIATLRNTSSLGVTDEIIEKMIIKAKNLVRIGNDGLETLAIEYLDYYRKKQLRMKWVCKTLCLMQVGLLLMRLLPTLIRTVQKKMLRKSC